MFLEYNSKKVDFKPNQLRKKIIHHLRQKLPMNLTEIFSYNLLPSNMAK